MKLIYCLFLFTLLHASMALLAQDWQTAYEKSDYLETPRYDETIAYALRLADASPWIHYESFGKSPQGRDLPLIIVDKEGLFTPEAARRAGKPVLLFQSCIHAGESDGKDASLMLIRDIAISKKLEKLADNAVLLFIPIFNVDGHERFGPNNRINQNGPAEMGFRSNAQGLNLNRDFLKAETPEMQGWLQLFQRWLPDFMVDNHVTDGADWQYALSYGIAKRQTMAEPLRMWTSEVLEPWLNKKMADKGYPIMEYFRLKNRADISKGVAHFPLSPRFSTGFGAVNNRIFFLVECHALKDYRTRVSANYYLMQYMLELISRDREILLAANRQADRETAALPAGSSIPLAVATDMQDSSMIDFLAVDYDVQTSDLSGGPWVRYYNNKKRTIRLPHFNQTVVSASAELPYAYLIPQEWLPQLDIMKQHGIVIQRLDKAVELQVSSYRLSQVKWQSATFEGRVLPDFHSEPLQEKRVYPAGTAVIRCNQRTNRLIAALLEPEGPDSFIRWGMWSSIFERKEYAEDYYLEKLARRMIAENPQLKEEFDAALAANPEQFPNHWAKLYFFYARSPYWEQDVAVYPVGKLMEPAELKLVD